MSNPELHDDASDAVDEKMVELIKSHQSAMQHGDFASADILGAEVLNRAMEAMLEAAERDEVPEDFLLHAEATECEERGDWDGAFAAYRRVLEVAEQDSSPFGIWSAHDNLANLHYLLNEHESALKEQRLATTAAREADSNIGLRTALIAEAQLLLRLERATEAALRVHEGLAISDDTEPLDELGSARLRVLQAECEASFGHVVEARQLLQEVYSVVQRAEQMPGAAGYHSAHCSWWRVESRCCETEDNPAGEIRALERALTIARRIDEMSHCSGVYTKANVMRALNHLARALWREGKSDEAQHMQRESEAIRVAWKLPDRH